MPHYNHVHLEAFGHAIPDHVVTSADIERELAPVYDRFGLHEGRLELMTGIQERRFWDPGTPPSHAAVIAGKRALENANLTGPDIDCLIYAAVSRDFLEPATASVVHHHLALPHKSMMFDISNACLGFINAMQIMANMIELRQIKSGLVVASESGRQLVRTTIDRLLQSKTLTRQEFKTAFASLTIGSGAIALVMTHDSVSKTNHRLLGGVMRTATESNHLCRGSEDTGFAAESEMFMSTDSETLLQHGCALAKETWSDFARTMEWSADDVDRVFCHQVGIAHRDALYDAVGFDTRKDFSTFDRFGNVGSVSLPLTMALGLDNDPPTCPTKIAMLGIGSGLSCAMLGVHWQP
ncbi:MAG: 3-oxoacyl-ACP synthase III [Planctomycetota bacterium]